MREPEDQELGYGDYRPYLEALGEAFVDRLGSSLLCLVLYGSVARGTARPDSDIDLLVVLRGASSRYFARLSPILDVVAELEQTPAARALRARGLHPIPAPLCCRRRRPQKTGTSSWTWWTMPSSSSSTPIL